MKQQQQKQQQNKQYELTDLNCVLLGWHGMVSHHIVFIKSVKQK